MVKNNTGILNIIPPLAIMILMTVLSERHLNKFHKTELQITTIFKAIFTVFTAFFVHYTFKFIFEILYDITNNPKFKNLFHLFSSKINEYNTTQTYVLFSFKKKNSGIFYPILLLPLPFFSCMISSF